MTTAQNIQTGQHYAFRVTGPGHGFSNAEAKMVLGNKVVFQPKNIRGENVGPTQTVYTDSITEITAL